MPELAPAQAPVVVAGSNASASAVLEAFVAQRNELRSQLSKLASERLSIARRLREGEVSGVDKAGLEARLQQLDGRILEMNKAVAEADLRVATQTGVPGAEVPSRPFEQNDPPPAMIMAFVLSLVVLVPMSIAFARRIWRRGSVPIAAPAMTPELDDRLNRLEQAMDAVAVEIERIGEGQRFVTRVLGAGPAEPVATRVREGVEVRR